MASTDKHSDHGLVHFMKYAGVRRRRLYPHVYFKTDIYFLNGFHCCIRTQSEHD